MLLWALAGMAQQLVLRHEGPAGQTVHFLVRSLSVVVEVRRSPSQGFLVVRVEAVAVALLLDRLVRMEALEHLVKATMAAMGLP
jgi:nitrate reductase NapAB chaperone NapD